MPSPLIGRAERLAPWLTGIAYAAAILIVRYPPMADLPLHEAAIGLARHWGNTTFAPPSIYMINPAQPNQLFALLSLTLSYVMPVEWATKAVVAGMLLALPLAASRFADYVSAPRWTALLAGPVCVGWLFYWGLVANILGLVVLLVLLPPLDRFASHPTARGLVAMMLAAIWMHLAHQVVLMIGFGVLGLCSLGAPGGRRAHALRGGALAFMALVVYVGSRYSWLHAGPMLRAMDPFVFVDTWHKIETASGVLFGGYEAYVRHLLLVLGLLPALLFALERHRNRPSVRRSWVERAHAWRFELAGLLLLVCYFTFPAVIKATTLVYHRFLPPAWCLLAICSGAGTRRTARLIPKAVCVALPVASLLVAWPRFADADRLYRDADALMSFIEPGNAILTLDLGPNEPHRLVHPAVVEAHVVAARGGRSAYDYTQSPISIVVQRPEKLWDEMTLRLVDKPLNMRPAHDFKRFRYVVLATRRPGLAAAVKMAFADEARLIAAAGELYLFESKLAVEAVDSDNVALPDPRPETLRKRLRVVARLLEEQVGSAGDAEAPPL
ncbi:MAG: hypothetical protein ABTD50_05695 [Polyangiaceae bacterium]